MSDLNQFICTGRLTRDPQTRFLANDKAVASFSLAVGKTYTSNGEKKEETLFIDCEAWGRLAEIIGQHCGKGKQVAIVARLKLDDWQDKDGQRRQKIKAVVDELTMLGSSKDAAHSPAPAAPAQKTELQRDTKPAVPVDDEPPF